MLRAALLGAANNRGLQRFVSAHGRRLGADRFVAGETADEFLRVVRELNAKGFHVAAGLLGEDVREPADAAAVAREYEALLERFARERADANVALKLTHLGLAIDQDLAFENLRSVTRKAAEFGNFVRIDMEQSVYTEATLSMYRRLRAAGADDVGTVLQAYLYRSEQDLQALLPMRPNLRLVKGAYLEPPALAYPRKRDVDANFVRLIETALQGCGYTAIATHDYAVLEHALAFAQRNSIPYDRFEVQMLYGVRPKLHAAMRGRGVKVRVAVPFGSQWFPYFMRRLAERPANVFFFLSSMWRG